MSSSTHASKPANPVALITGGAMGLGLEVARQLAARGWRLALADFNRSAGEQALAELRGKGAHAELYVVDLSSAEGPRAMVDWAVPPLASSICW